MKPLLSFLLLAFVLPVAAASSNASMRMQASIPELLQVRVDRTVVGFDLSNLPERGRVRVESPDRSVVAVASNRNWALMAQIEAGSGAEALANAADWKLLVSCDGQPGEVVLGDTLTRISTGTRGGFGANVRKVAYALELEDAGTLPDRVEIEVVFTAIYD